MEVVYKSYGFEIDDLREVNPSDFTYEELKYFGKRYGVNMKKLSQKIGVSTTTIRKYADRNNGVVGSRYYFMLIGVIFTTPTVTLSMVK